MSPSFKRLFAFLATARAASAMAVDATGIFQRQTDTTCTSQLHLMIAGGCSLPCATDSPGLLNTLISNITTKYPKSDQYIVPYDNSTYQGAVSTTLMINSVNEYAASCPNTPIVFIGYSLGGIITMNTLCGGVSSDLAPNVVAAITYGEETFRYPESYDFGSCTQSAPKFARNNTDQCVPFAPAIHSYCDEGDPNCCTGGQYPLDHFVYPQEYDLDALAFVESRYSSYLQTASSTSTTSSQASTTTSILTTASTTILTTTTIETTLTLPTTQTSVETTTTLTATTLTGTTVTQTTTTSSSVPTSTQTSAQSSTQTSSIVPSANVTYPNGTATSVLSQQITTTAPLSSSTEAASSTTPVSTTTAASITLVVTYSELIVPSSFFDSSFIPVSAVVVPTLTSTYVVPPSTALTSSQSTLHSETGQTTTPPTSGGSTLTTAPGIVVTTATAELSGGSITASSSSSLATFIPGNAGSAVNVPIMPLLACLALVCIW